MVASRVGPDDELVQAIRRALAHAGDPGKAEPMRAYMKSEMPYRGIPSPVLKAVLKPILADRTLDEETWYATVLELWDEAEFREERYAALALAGHRLHREHRQVGSVGSRPSRASSRGVHGKAEEGGDAPASTTDDNAARCPWGGAQQDMGLGVTALVVAAVEGRRIGGRRNGVGAGR